MIIPALNEEDNLALVLEGLPPVDEIIVVDGGSADDTVAIAREVRPEAVVIRQTRTGKGNALICGFAASSCDIVVTLNADGTTDPGEIPRYVDALLAGAEVAHGSRYREGGGNLDEGRWDRAGTRGFNRLVNTLFGTRFTDLGFGYNAFWRVLVPVLDLPDAEVPGLRRGTRLWGDGPEIEPLINIRMAVQGLRVVEVASVGYPRIYGIRERRPMQEGSRAVRTALAEYLRRWRMGRTAPRAATSHAPRHGSAHGGTGMRASRRQIAPPAPTFFPDEDPGLLPGDGIGSVTGEDGESTGRHSIERILPDRAPRRRRPGWSDLTRGDPALDGPVRDDPNWDDPDRDDPNRYESSRYDQRSWRESYTEPAAAGLVARDEPQRRSRTQRRRRADRDRLGDGWQGSDVEVPGSQTWTIAGRRSNRHGLTVISGDGDSSEHSPSAGVPAPRATGQVSHLRAVPGERYGEG